MKFTLYPRIWPFCPTAGTGPQLSVILEAPVSVGLTSLGALDGATKII